MKTCIAACLSILLIIVSGCGPATKQQAVKRENIQLTGDELVRAVSGKSLILSAYDFSGTVYFQTDGQLSGVDNQDQRDIGRWKISGDEEMCLKFRLWYYGDAKCYSVFSNPRADRLTFFTSNGAAYYTAMSIAGDPAALAAQLKEKSSNDNRTAQSTSPQTSATVEQDKALKTAEEPRNIATSASQKNDSEQTVKRLAGNCPGCNMAGIKLNEASLIKANLQGANLEGADLRYANLRRADLSGAILKNARLNHANLPGADLSNTDLSGADLSGANLLLTNFTGANISGALFTNANLEKTIGLPDIP